jgi:hypothetical protein
MAADWSRRYGIARADWRQAGGTRASGRIERREEPNFSASLDLGGPVIRIARGIGLRRFRQVSTASMVEARAADWLREHEQDFDSGGVCGLVEMAFVNLGNITAIDWRR